MSQDLDPVRVRAIFLSDVHLGTRGCQADLLLGFLRRYEAGTIYLVGDIIDGWRLKSGWYWPQAHNDVVQLLLGKVRGGARLIYIPGNHDEFLRDYIGSTFGGVELASHAIHEAADGRRYLVTHGDEFDLAMRHAPWLAHLGDGAYRLALALNTIVSRVRRRLGLTYWSLSAWAKLKVKNAVNFIGRYEEMLVAEARHHGVDGVICGHIHHAACHDALGIRYVNTGDWVESCTGAVEHADGRIEIVRWAETTRAPARKRAERRTARARQAVA